MKLYDHSHIVPRKQICALFQPMFSRQGNFSSDKGGRAVKMKAITIALALLYIMGATGGLTLAQTAPPGIKVSVALDKPAYLLTDPIKVGITLENISGGAVLASQGLTNLPLTLLLTFTDPDGRPITANQQDPHVHEGPPPPVLPIDGTLVQVDPLQTLGSTFVSSVTIPNIKTFYTITKAGFWSAKITVPIRTYPAIFRTVSGIDYAQLETANFAGSIQSADVRFALVVDADGDGYSYPVPLAPYNTTAADCNDANPNVHPGAIEIVGNGIDDDCNPLTSDTAPPIQPATINVKAEQHNVGSGSNPPTTKVPLANMPIHVFETANSCVSKFGNAPQKAKSIWISCPSKYQASTKVDGTATIAVAPGSYLVMGDYVGDDGLPVTDDDLFPGSPTGALASGGSVQKFLQIIVKSNGKKTPATVTVQTGSLLIITEPAYVEWDSAQELYPFIYETQGQWTVTTTITPPDGFVADKNTITAVVQDAVKAVQFTLTDLGSAWVPTKVTHKVIHKGKPDVLINDSIGMQLSQRLAQAKGLNRSGLPLQAAQPGNRP